MSSSNIFKLEIVFVKYYAPNHMLASKDNTRLKWSRPDMSSSNIFKLEIVFVKYYAPNHMLASKDNTRLKWSNLQRAITSEIFFQNLFKS